MSGLLEKLQKSEGNSAAAWKATEPGDLVIGSIRDIQWVKRKMDESLALVVTIDVMAVRSEGKDLPQGIVNLWCGAIVEREALRMRIRKGDMFGVKYVGKLKDGRTKNYGVEV
jgi:hypothetical protein